MACDRAPIITATDMMKHSYSVVGTWYTFWMGFSAQITLVMSCTPCSRARQAPGQRRTTQTNVTQQAYQPCSVLVLTNSDTAGGRNKRQ